MLGIVWCTDWSMKVAVESSPASGRHEGMGSMGEPSETTPGLQPLSRALEDVARRLKVKSVLVMRSEPDAMVVAASAGEAVEHYHVGDAGQKARASRDRVPLYCERVVDSDEGLFVPDSRQHEVFSGNEDEVNFGLVNYLGVPVHDDEGTVVGTVCVLDDHPREYTDDDHDELRRLRSDVEILVRTDRAVLSD